MKFGKDFLWGAAASAYQTEGAYNEDGRGMSVWDVFAHKKGKVYGSQNGDVACDGYHRFYEDVDIMESLGIKAYRFSVSWSRIFPDDSGKVNLKGLDYYNRLVDALLEKNITPFVTLYHWDMPCWTYERGGWLCDDIIGLFAEYAGIVAEKLSDRVKHYITFNEPQCFIGLGHIKGEHAPGIRCTNKEAFKMAHNVLRSHGKAVQSMRAAAKYKINIGYAPMSKAAIPSTSSKADIEAARKKYFSCPDIKDWYWNVSWWSDPVILGKYPEEGLIKYREYLPQISGSDMKLICQPLDFYCQNIYRGVYVKADKNGEPEILTYPENTPVNSLGWEVTPECLMRGPQFLYERYKLPIYITENGFSAHDRVSADGRIHDKDRISYILKHIEALYGAVSAGVDVRGYFYWSLLDNFEWAEGYKERFGLVYVDFATGNRIVKDSGFRYRDLIKAQEGLH